MLMRKWVCEAARQSGRQGHESLPDASIPDNLLSAYAGIVDEIEIGLTEYKSLGLQPALESKREDNALVVFCRGECAHSNISIYVDQPANIIVRYGFGDGDAAKYTMSQVGGE